MGLEMNMKSWCIRLGHIDYITFRVESRPDALGHEKPVKDRLVDQLRMKTNLGYHIELHDHCSLLRYEVKGR
jgi:phenylacetate-CoA ligase